MKAPALLTSLILTLLPLHASAVTLAYDTVYDDRSRSLATVACSDGRNGLLTRNFTTFGSLPSFPRIGGAQAITGWNSSACGTCWEVTYTNSSGIAKSLNITAIDVAGAGFNLAQVAMDELTNGHAVEFGRVEVTSRQVNASACGL
uniref:Cerato-platanin 6 n=1 Tax=Moniliophthora perniciosa TaxID=153609 RepID=S4TC44_MONPR|nr:cerato-platanin 6 [Moniliophthora perniciosa]